MGRSPWRLLVPVLLLAASGAAAAAAQDEAGSLARRERLARAYLEESGWRESFAERTGRELREQEAAGRFAPGFASRFREVADFDALFEDVVRIHRDRLDGEALEAAVREVREGGAKRFEEGPRALLDDVEARRKRWFVEAKLATLKSLRERPPAEEERAGPAGPTAPPPAGAPEEPEGGAGEPPPATGPTAGEKAAIALLAEIAAAQRQVRNGAFIDVDGDGVGEYATLMELSGTTGIRAQFDQGKRGSGFSQKGAALAAPILSPELGRRVDGEGIVTLHGYCIRVLLPGVEDRAKFVFESGPPPDAAIVGRTPLVGIDSSESAWCAYAWPEKRGEGGTRAFFVNQEGRVLQSPNRRIGWQGRERAIRPDAAFTGLSITSAAAVGTVGRDGELWKVVE